MNSAETLWAAINNGSFVDVGLAAEVLGSSLLSSLTASGEWEQLSDPVIGAYRTYGEFVTTQGDIAPPARHCGGCAAFTQYEGIAQGILARAGQEVVKGWCRSGNEEVLSCDSCQQFQAVKRVRK